MGRRIPQLVLRSSLFGGTVASTLLTLVGMINLLNAGLGHVAVPQVGLTGTSSASKAA